MKTHLKKLLIIAIAFLFIISIAIISNANELTTGIINAMNENGIPVTEDDVLFSISTNNQSSKNYYEFTQSDVTIDTDVSGDVYVLSNGNVTINSNVFGNVFVC